MYLGAQRVMDANSETSVTLYLYLHCAGVSVQQQHMLSDVRWVSQLAPGQLAREHHEGTPGGRRILSYLELSGPDDTTSAQIEETIDMLRDHVAAGGKDPIIHGQCGAELFCGAEVGRTATDELAQLRAELLSFFSAGEAMPPKRGLTILVSREGDVTRFSWEPKSRAQLLTRFPDWQPHTLSVHDDVRAAFEPRYGALYPHAVGVLSPDPLVDLDNLGGVAFEDAQSRRVLWFTPKPRSQ